MPKGAVASELAKDGKKKTIFRDLGNAHSLHKLEDSSFTQRSCHMDVSDLSQCFRDAEFHGRAQCHAAVIVLSFPGERNLRLAQQR